jgi:hypothetical protein
MIYIYRSEAGTFTIEPDGQAANMFMLSIGGMWLGTYETPEAAASDVFRRCTGWLDWDCPAGPDAPRDLSCWEKG